VLAPATAYVREFTRAVARAKVVRAGSILEPGPAPDDLPAVAATAPVADIAARFLDGTARLRVVDGAGVTLGVVRRDEVVRLMLGG